MGPYAACFPHPAVTAPAACAERLAAALQIKCLTGLADAKVKNTTAQGRPANFDEWIMRVMGGGIADLFMRPYNFKVGAQPWTVSVCLPYAALVAFAVPVELCAAEVHSTAFCTLLPSTGMQCVGHSAAADHRCILPGRPSVQCTGNSVNQASV